MIFYQSVVIKLQAMAFPVLIREVLQRKMRRYLSCLTTARQVVFLYLNFVRRMKNSTDTRLDMVVRNDIRTI